MRTGEQHLKKHHGPVVARGHAVERERRFPARVDIGEWPPNAVTDEFLAVWKSQMKEVCHAHPVWTSPFVRGLGDDAQPALQFELAAVWSINMIRGSYCFPRYVAALAAR